MLFWGFVIYDGFFGLRVLVCRSAHEKAFHGTTHRNLMILFTHLEALIWAVSLVAVVATFVSGNPNLVFVQPDGSFKPNYPAIIVYIVVYALLMVLAGIFLLIGKRFDKHRRKKNKAIMENAYHVTARRR
jgi:predicted small integral membrane protein